MRRRASAGVRVVDGDGEEFQIAGMALSPPAATIAGTTTDVFLPPAAIRIRLARGPWIRKRRSCLLV